MNILIWTLITSAVSGQQHNINNKYGNNKCSVERLQKQRLNLGLSVWSVFADNNNREMGTIKYLKWFNCINLYLQINYKCKKNRINANYRSYFKIRLLLSICPYPMCFLGSVHNHKSIYVQIQHEMWETSGVLSFLYFIHNMKIFCFPQLISSKYNGLKFSK